MTTPNQEGKEAGIGAGLRSGPGNAGLAGDNPRTSADSSHQEGKERLPTSWSGTEDGETWRVTVDPDCVDPEVGQEVLIGIEYVTKGGGGSQSFAWLSSAQAREMAAALQCRADEADRSALNGEKDGASGEENSQGSEATKAVDLQHQLDRLEGELAEVRSFVTAKRDEYLSIDRTRAGGNDIGWMAGEAADALSDLLRLLPDEEGMANG